MMNIMLMRSMEMPIFDLTRQWLQADTSRLFHLVVTSFIRTEELRD